MSYCEICGFKLEESDVCIVCATKAPDDTESEDMIYCPECGKRTNGKNAYCRACGKKLYTINDGLTDEEREEKERRKKRINLLVTNIVGLVIGFWFLTGISSYFTIAKIEKERELHSMEKSANKIGEVCLIIGSIRLALFLLSFFIGQMF